MGEPGVRPEPGDQNSEKRRRIDDVPILNEAQARDSIIVYLDETYGIKASGEWAEKSFAPSENTTMIRVYTSEDWTVEVEFEPAAPLVSSYAVRVENSSEEFLWEGEITLRGEVEEISFSQ